MDFVKGYTTGRERARRFTQQAAELRRHPGEWGILVEDAPNRWTAKHVSTGQLIDFAPRGTFQGSARKNDDGTYTILARFLAKPRTQHRSDVATTPAPSPDLEAFGIVDAADFTTGSKVSNPLKMAKAVRKKEGAWCVISRGEVTTSIARDITKGRSDAFPAYEYKAVAVRDVKTKLFDIYARYVGLDA